jgi:glycosyltransferase involved in cell wall biosynthesis
VPLERSAPGSARPWRARVGTCVLIPCLNEVATIGALVGDFRRALPEAAVVVLDNGSTDGSAREATAAGATVLAVARRGKGNVLRAALDRVRADCYVIVDGDGTYSSADVDQLMQPVLRGDADMVVGARSRLTRRDAMRPLHRVGNKLIVGFLNLCFRSDLRDILSGYRVLSGSAVRNLPLLAPGFEVETELTLECLERDLRILEVPISYQARPAGSRSKLNSFRDGYRIVMTIMALLRDYRPMTFFSGVAGLILCAGVAGGSVVISDYLRTGLVPRLPLAILSSVLILLAAVFLATGFIVSAINRRFAEMSVLSERWRADSIEIDIAQ